MTGRWHWAHVPVKRAGAGPSRPSAPLSELPGVSGWRPASWGIPGMRGGAHPRGEHRGQRGRMAKGVWGLPCWGRGCASPHSVSRKACLGQKPLTGAPIGHAQPVVRASWPSSVSRKHLIPQVLEGPPDQAPSCPWRGHVEQPSPCCVRLLLRGSEEQGEVRQSGTVGPVTSVTSGASSDATGKAVTLGSPGPVPAETALHQQVCVLSQDLLQQGRTLPLP